MAVKLNFEGETLTAFLSGEIDHHNSREMRCEIDESIIRATPKVLELNFKDVSFMDSSGIGLIMGRYKLASSLGASVCVTEASGYLKRVMKLAGIDSIVSLNQGEKTKGSKEEKNETDKSNEA